MRDRVFFYRGYLQAVFFIALVMYVWFFPEDTVAGTLAGSGVGRCWNRGARGQRTTTNLGRQPPWKAHPF